MRNAGLFITLISSSACVHAKINHERQNAYFTCPNVQVGQAEANLAVAGWPIENATANSVTTGFRLILIEDDERLTILSEDRQRTERIKVGRSQYRVRITAGKVGANDVRFHIFQTIGDKLIDWDVIFDPQIEHDTTRKELNRYRSAVCGGPPFFGS